MSDDVPDPEEMSTDEMLELMDEDPEMAERVREKQQVQDLQEYAAQFSHEDALFEAASEGDDGE